MVAHVIKTNTQESEDYHEFKVSLSKGKTLPQKETKPKQTKNYFCDFLSNTVGSLNF